MATTIYGATIKGYWRTYLSYNYYPNHSGTQSRIDWWYGIAFVKAPKGNGDTNGNYQCEFDKTYVACTSQTTQNKYPKSRLTTTWWNNGGRSLQYGSGTFYFNKSTSAQSKTITAYLHGK